MGVEEAVAATAATEAASKGAEAGAVEAGSAAGSGAGAKGAEGAGLAAGESLTAPVAGEAAAGAAAAGEPLSLIAPGTEFTAAGLGEVAPNLGFVQGLTGAEGLNAAEGSVLPSTALPAAGDVSAGTGASAVSAPAGVTSPVGVDPTAALTDPTAAAGGPGAGGGSTPGGAGSSFPNAAGAVTEGGGTAGGQPAVGAEGGTTAAGGGSDTAGGAASSKSTGLSLDKLVSGAGDSIAKNPLGLAVAAGGLGYSILNGQQQSAATKAIADRAAAQGAESAVLTNYLKTGTLPAGMQAAVDQATAAAKARIISGYAAKGMSTDPTKNSALQQEIAQAEQQAIITASQLGERLMTAGLTESQMANTLYTQLQQIDQKQTENTGKAIASMAAALSGGGTKIQIGS